MALSMRTKVILPVAAAAVAGIAALAIALSGGGSQDVAPLPTSTVTRPVPTATIEQKLTPTPTPKRATPTPTSGQKVSETAECDGINVVYKINGKVQWKSPIATEADVAYGFVSKLSRLICDTDIALIVWEDYVVAVGIDRFDPDGKISFKDKSTGEEITGYFRHPSGISATSGYFHNGPFTDLARIPSTGFDDYDYILFLAQSYDSFEVGKAREKTGDKRVGPIPQIGVFGVDANGEVNLLAERPVYFGNAEMQKLTTNGQNLSFELSTASGTRQVSTTLADLLENPAANRYVPLVE